MDEAYWPACVRCFITSIGTRTAQAAISPREAASMWVVAFVFVLGALLVPSTLSPVEEEDSQFLLPS